MPRHSDRPQSRRHIFIYDEDYEFLIQQYGPDGVYPIGISEAVRRIIHGKVLQMRQRAIDAMDRLSQAGSMDEEYIANEENV
jgi:hypothetical protein